MHVLNGDLAAASFRLAFPDANIEDLLIFRDVLSCGPLQAFDDFASWMTRREAFWHSVLAEEPAPRRFAEWQRDFYGDWQALERADELVVWNGCALSDQLLLAFVVYHLDRLKLDPGKLELVQIECILPKKHVIRGLAELHPEQLREHPPSAHLDDTQIDFCLGTWKAVSCDTPDLLMQQLECSDPPMPVMHHALRLLVYRYPDADSGLSMWDRKILSCVRDHGPKCTRVMGLVLAPGLSDDDRLMLDSVGDSYLFARLRNLAAPTLETPLLEVNSTTAPMRDTVVSLTQAGEDVLDGKQNAITLNGIDDWIGGVHLDSSSDKIWFRKGTTLLGRS